MANYSYTAGMEGRGLEWIFVPMAVQTAPKAGIFGGYMKILQTAISSYFSSLPVGTGAQIIILENYVIPSGTGSFYNCIFLYNPLDPRRIPGDNIRFHDKDLPVKTL
jgi:hypothetical protein